MRNTYNGLDINQRINLKGLLVAWMDISVDRFQHDLDKKLYNRPRSARRRRLTRTGRLRNDWRHQLYGDFKENGSGISGMKLSFPLYGRFVEMGVGKGVDAALARYQGVRKNGEKRTRRPIRWYSRRKGFEIHRLRELLIKHYVNIPLNSLEAMLTDSVTVHV